MTRSTEYKTGLRLLPGLLAALLANCCLGQGTVYFSNIGAPGAITNGLTGQRAEVGTIFRVALYFAQDGILDEAQFVEVGAAVNINAFPGIFLGDVVTAPTAVQSGYGMFQVKAWESTFGASYEQASANTVPIDGRLALTGKSGIMRVDTGDVVTTLNPPASLVGWPAVVGTPLSQGFLLTVVPEPAVLLLLSLGLPVLLLRLRGRRRG